MFAISNKCLTTSNNKNLIRIVITSFLLLLVRHLFLGKVVREVLERHPYYLTTAIHESHIVARVPNASRLEMLPNARTQFLSAKLSLVFMIDTKENLRLLHPEERLHEIRVLRLHHLQHSSNRD